MEHKKYNAAIFIGRFQPIHHGHIKTIEQALEQAQRLIFIIGSSNSAPSIRQPWTAKQRIDMIKKCLSSKQLKRVHFIPIRDRIYSEFVWNQNILNEVSNKLRQWNLDSENLSIALIGHNKDATSYYLKNFPNWKFIETGNFEGINSTDFRKSYFSNEKPNYKIIPKPIQQDLKKFRKQGLFLSLKEEYLFVEHAKKKLVGNTFSVGNCFILCGNYMLLVRRKHFPGRHLLALPGGHLEPNELPKEGALRELYEETKIQLEKEELEKYFKSEGVFDYAERNPIGRSIAHVFFYQLNFLMCPKVTAGDDALEAHWILCDELSLLENQFFSDHYQIIQKFLGRVKGDA